MTVKDSNAQQSLQHKLGDDIVANPTTLADALPPAQLPAPPPKNKWERFTASASAEATAGRRELRWRGLLHLHEAGVPVAGRTVAEQEAHGVKGDYDAAVAAVATFIETAPPNQSALSRRQELVLYACAKNVALPGVGPPETSDALDDSGEDDDWFKDVAASGEPLQQPVEETRRRRRETHGVETRGAACRS